MTRSIHHPLLLITALFFLSIACAITGPAPAPEEFTDQVATSVASTLTALPPIAVSPTDTPLPLPTETLPAPPTFTPPPTLPPTTAPTARPDYACDIIDQRPRDDTTFERNADFDVRWTLVNTGTQRWRSGTYLEYLSGPKMTEVRFVELPRLRPGEEHEVILDAAAPEELDRQVMVWAVFEPEDDEVMCYPYTRIIVER